MKKMNDEIFNLCVELPLIEDRLRRAGLHKTAKMMNRTIQKIGWEAAEVREKAEKVFKRLTK